MWSEFSSKHVRESLLYRCNKECDLCVLQKSRDRDGFHAGGPKDSGSSCLETGLDPRVAFQQVGWTVGAGSMDSPHLDLAGA